MEMSAMSLDKQKDYKMVLDIYWDVIEACEEMQKDYLGKSDIYTKHGPRIAPDSVGNVVDKLIKARKTYPIQRVTTWQQQ